MKTYKSVPYGKPHAVSSHVWFCEGDFVSTKLGRDCKRIFTFWEPRDCMPGYIQCCVETWQKNMPGYQIAILDWSNIGEWMTPEELDAVVCKGMTLAMQSDCLRCALLYKYGGIWMDADTILTRPLNPILLESGCTFIGRNENGIYKNYGAFVSTQLQSDFISKWYAALIPRIERMKKFYRNPLLRLVWRNDWRKIRKWDYCVNAIIDPLSNNDDSTDYRFIDAFESKALPELISQCGEGKDAYVKFWFSDGAIDQSKIGSIILLHNSWTPIGVKSMSKSEFLGLNIRISNFMKSLMCG